MRNYDPVFHVVAVGDAVYFGSSVDDAVRCIDVKTARQRWIAYTDGPVRIAPTVADGKLYVGSDDGSAYCLALKDGERLWAFSPTPDTRRVLHNGRFISRWPVRTGVLVADGTAYFGAALLPWEPSYLCAVDAATGKPTGQGRYVAKHGGLTLEGALLASKDRLIVPQGRVSPLVFDRGSGAAKGGFKGGGGCMVVLTDDDQILHGPGNKAGWITASRTTDRGQVANFPRGNAVVVAGTRTYLLTDQHLAALDRKSNRPIWRVKCACPNEIILGRDVLFAAGDGAVAAFSVTDGKELWKHAVRGRAYGLAVANGALFASTDEGAIHCFRPTGEGKPRLPQIAEPTPLPKEGVAIPAHKDEALIGRWVFHQSVTVDAKGKPAGGKLKGARFRPLAGKLLAAVHGEPSIVRAGGVEAVRLNGKNESLLVAADHKTAGLPKRDITVEAWVRVDRPQEWGGIVGALQDNGNYERGWLLGFRKSSFSFALAAEGGTDSVGYLVAETPFKPTEWYHVAGTYDGTTKRLYVNGRLAGSSTDQKGDIRYPPKTWFELGAYHDNDEYFRTAGQLHEVCVYRRALSASELAARHKAGRLRLAGPLSLAVGLMVEFDGPRSAVVRWRTEQPSASVVELAGNGPIRRLADGDPKSDHAVTLPKLGRNRLYSYRIESTVDGIPRRTPWTELDTFFNYSVAPMKRPPGLPPKGATEWPRRSVILKHTPIRDGICLMLGAIERGELNNLIYDSRLRAIVVDNDAKRVDAMRQSLAGAAMYGARATARQVTSLSKLPFPDCIADVVVLRDAAHQAEATRVLRPGGTGCILGPKGVARTFTRPPLPNTGSWTHAYARADNSAYGGESLGGATSIADLQVQWLGRPGPRAQADRNGRKPPPLAVGGRLFLQGLERIIAINAYNGTVLWSRELPGFRRFNVPRDCSNWCADAEHVYAVVRDKAYRLDAATGKLARTDAVVAGPQADWAWDWGYVARDGGALFGSAVKQGTAYTDFWGGGGWYDHKAAPKVCSDLLFARDVVSGDVLWKRAAGLILNSTVTVGSGRVCFVESRNFEVRASSERRVAMHQLWQSQFLTALDAKTGRKLWETHVDMVDAVTVIYLAASDGRLVLVSSGSETYHVRAFDAANGQMLWETRFPWPKGDHGAHMSRPAIAGSRVFVRPRVFHLSTGEAATPGMPGGGCGTYAATDHALFFRDSKVTMWHAESGKTTSFARLRPDCWLSTIPACGMLLSPEGGGGCSCGSWMETSLGFLPKAKE